MRVVDRFVLGGPDLEVAVLTYGATIQSVLVPDRDGRVDDVVGGIADTVTDHNVRWGFYIGYAFR